ncbi:universal stress protein [Halorubrum sp. CSM-61]|uniref:universal stress protein n=1 Tax=Halorubrum sp. CSM-61 TaxID=2485838 RepID=UPI000F4C4A10|nr:universal stress protein [Halorubrum sp. CSM-61]
MVIVSAVDGAEDRRVVEEGVSLAEAFGEELHVLHVASREDIERPEGGGSETVLERAENRAADVGADVADDFVAVGRIGRPAQEIDDYVSSTETRYLVVGGRKRTPIGKALFGSITQSVLLSVDCPVVAVRERDE